jgi:hypothetical protein
MKRCVNRLFTALSVLACIATCLLWARGYVVADIVTIRDFRNTVPGVEDYRVIIFVSDGGEITITRSRFVGAVNVSDQFAGTSERVLWQTLPGTKPYRANGHWWKYFWFAFEHERQYQSKNPPLEPIGYESRYVAVVIPDWAILAACSILPVRTAMSHLRSARARKRVALGQCVACGYCLQSSPERCPECGSPREVITSNK